jgi:hypothetical protein
MSPVSTMVKRQRNISPQDKALIERQVAKGLRSLYDGIVDEALPDAMAALLQRLGSMSLGTVCLEDGPRD